MMCNNFSFSFSSLFRANYVKCYRLDVKLGSVEPGMMCNNLLLKENDVLSFCFFIISFDQEFMEFL